MAVASGPLVSVIITNYNYGRFLPEAIESVKAQTYPNVEIIVVDDGSTDNSREVIRSYGKELIPIFQEHAGQVAGWNTGFFASSGDIIAFLDADDIFLPHKLEEVVYAYQQFPNIGWCIHRVERENSLKKTTLLAPAVPDGCLDLRERVRMGRGVPIFSGIASSITIKRSVLSLFVPMPVPNEDRAIYTDDGYLKVMAIGLAPGYGINKPLSRIKIHEQNRRTGNAQSKILVIKRNIWLAWYILDRFPRYATRFAVRVLGLGWRIGWRYEPQEQETFSSYWRKINLPTKASILSRASLYAVRDALFPNRED